MGLQGLCSLASLFLPSSDKEEAMPAPTPTPGISLLHRAELAFKTLDKNNNGILTRREFTKLFQTKAQADAAMAKFDEDGDEKVDFQEFVKDKKTLRLIMHMT